MLEIVEFFLVYDFVFFKSMIDWSNEQKNNGLAWLIEYGRVLQFSVLLASGKSVFFSTSYKYTVADGAHLSSNSVCLFVC